MSKLLLDSLEIKGYRCFEHLTIEKLGRVNLIVGKNNVGKTALLEALWFFAEKGLETSTYESLFNRDEVSDKTVPGNYRQKENLTSLKNLFYDRPDLTNKTTNTTFSIGSVKDSRENQDSIFDDSSDKPTLSGNLVVLGARPSSTNSENSSLYSKTGVDMKNFSSYFIRTPVLDNKDLVKMWDKIERNALEDFVNESLRTIEEKLIDVRFASYSGNDRVPVARLKNANERVTLKSLGEGMSHLLGIALTLVECKDGLLLIDEIERGFHYSVLLDVWRLIFKTARNLNAQVFATTHSSDCLKAFQRAAEEDKEDEGMLIRLVRKGDKIKAVLFNEQEMETVVENDIEVR